MTLGFPYFPRYSQSELIFSMVVISASLGCVVKFMLIQPVHQSVVLVAQHFGAPVESTDEFNNAALLNEFRDLS